MATNYKKLKWGTNTPDTVKWNTATPEYPGLVKWGSTPVFARAVDFNFATKDGISSFTYSLASYAVPSAATRSGYYYWGDAVLVTATLASWWTINSTSATIFAKDHIPLTKTTASAVTVKDYFSPTRMSRDLKISLIHMPTGLADVSYIDTSGNGRWAEVLGGESSTVQDVWAGNTDFNIIAESGQSYYTYTFTTAGAIPGTSMYTISFYQIPATRNLTVYKTGATGWISSITATYTKVNYPGQTSASTAATTVYPSNATSTYNNLWQGSDVNLTATRSNNYTSITITSEHASASESYDAEFTVHAEGYTRTLDYQEKGDNAAFNANRVLVFTDPTTGNIQQVYPTGSHQYTMWQGEVPIYTPIANTYYTINVISRGTAAGTTTATITATGAAKERTLNIGAFAFGMSKFSWNTTSDSGSTTITIGATVSIKQPYTYNYSVTSPSPDYFNITMTPTKNEPGDTNITVNFSSTGKTRNYRLYWTDQITSVNGQYISGSWITTNYAPAVSGSGSQTYTNVWRGAGITVNATATSYYTPEYTMSNMDAGINDAACTITAAATPRKVRVAFAGSYTVALASVTVNFASVGATGTAKDYHPTSSTTYTEVWAGSDVTTTAEANQYFNIDVDKPTITKDDAASEATVNISGSYAKRSWTIATITGYQNVTTHSFSFINTLNPDVVTTVTNYNTYNTVWQGGKCTISATAASYWMPVVWEGIVSHSNGSDTYTYEFPAGTNNISSFLGAARRPRNIKVNLHETDSRVSRALSAVAVTYQDTSGNSQTVNPTTSTTYIAWSGYAVTASASSKAYASVTVTSTDWAAGYTDAIVDVTCTLASRQAAITVVQNEDSCISNMTLTYVKSDTGASTAVSPAQAGTYYYVWQGAAVNLYVGLLNNYYTHSVTSYNQGASSSTASFYVYASARGRYVSGTFTSISKVSASSSEHNVDITGSGYYLKQPYTYDLTATAAQYWKNASVLPTQVTPGSSTVTLTLSAERETRKLYLTINNRDRGSGTITATYGGAAADAKLSLSISGTTTQSTSSADAWQGQAITNAAVVTDTTNYTVGVTSSGTSIGIATAYITANIYGKTVNHTLAVWPSGLGTWYSSSGSATTSMSVSRNSPMTYSNWTGTRRTASISAYSLSTSIAPYVQCTTNNFVVMSLSYKPTLGPTTPTTFTAYIGKPITVTVSIASGQRSYYGISAATFTYMPTTGNCSQSVTSSVNLMNSSSYEINRYEYPQALSFKRKSSYWTMVINGTNRTSTSYTISSFAASTTVTVDAFRNTPTDMTWGDGYHIRDQVLDCTDGFTLNGQMTIWNDTNYSVKFYIHFEADTSGGHWSSTERTVTVAARSSQFWSEDYYDGAGEIEYGYLYIRCEEESSANLVTEW